MPMRSLNSLSSLITTATGKGVVPVSKTRPQLFHYSAFHGRLFLSRSLINHKHDAILFVVHVVGGRRRHVLLVLTAASKVWIGVLVSGPPRRRLCLRNVMATRLLLMHLGSAHLVVEALQESVYTTRILSHTLLRRYIVTSVMLSIWRTVITESHEAATWSHLMLRLLVRDDRG